MADEHSVHIETHIPINFTKGAGTAIAKGAFLKMTDGMVAILADGDGDIPAGVAQSDALSGDTSVAVYRGGVFRGVAGVAGVTVGEAIRTDVSTSSVNRLVDADVNDEQIVGISFETAASGASFLYELMPRAVDLA